MNSNPYPCLRSRLRALLLLVCAVLVRHAAAYATCQDPAPPRAAPLKVFVLAGQSNMQGHAHVRTLEVLGLDPASAPLRAAILDADGAPRVCDRVWISSIGCADQEQVGRLTVGFGVARGGPKIGPELTFGLTLERLLDEPLLIVKTSWGGKSLHTDFRPPSAGPYVFHDDQRARFAERGLDLAQVEADKAAATGRHYRMMIDHVQAVLADPGRVVPAPFLEHGVELAGFVWFQGWNDLVDRDHYPQRDRPGGYDDYTRLLKLFIQDVRKDLGAEHLPFVIGVLGVGGEFDRAPQTRTTGVHRNFRAAMAAPAAAPEFRDTVRAVQTATYWDHELSDLRRADDAIRRELDAKRKAGELDDAAFRAALAARREEAFPPRERTLLEKGASNAEYHYLGSARILGGIGQGFAEAMAELLRER